MLGVTEVNCKNSGSYLRTTSVPKVVSVEVRLMVTSKGWLTFAVLVLVARLIEVAAWTGEEKADAREQITDARNRGLSR